MRRNKPFWASKTLWANVAVGLTALAVLPELPLGWGRWALLLASILNIGLRVVTTQPLTTAKGKP